MQVLTRQTQYMYKNETQAHSCHLQASDKKTDIQGSNQHTGANQATVATSYSKNADSPKIGVFTVREFEFEGFHADSMQYVCNSVHKVTVRDKSAVRMLATRKQKRIENSVRSSMLRAVCALCLSRCIVRRWDHVAEMANEPCFEPFAIMLRDRRIQS